LSGYQLFSIIVLFQLGTTVIFGFAAGSGRDAWLAGIASAALGSALIAGYAGITKLTGYVSLTQWFRRAFGPFGVPLAWLYPLLFVYDAGRILKDLAFLVPSTLLPNTPHWVFNAAFLVVAVYLIFSGIEVLGRVAGALLPVLVLFGVLETALLFASDSLQFDRFLPIAGEGWGRIAESVWPMGITQTYGESIEMAVFWHLLHRRRSLPAIGVAATWFAGAIIVLFDSLAIAALGEHLFMELIFPDFMILNLSSVAGFLENLNALGAMFFLCTAFVKITVHLYAAALCVRELTAASRSAPAVWATAGAAFVLYLTMGDNFHEHIVAGTERLPYTLWVPMFLVLPAGVAAFAAAGRPRYGKKALR
jgi:spore germination protein KB